MRLLALGFLSLALVLGAEANAERRALVIGIDAYREVPPLEKAVGDARAMAVTLQGLGFTVTEAIDPDRRALNQAIATFGTTLSQGDTALVHFSGHGVEIDGENYLLPADAPKPVSGGENFIKAEAIAMSALVSTIEDAGAGTRIFVIDACRDNPFEQVGVRSVGGTRGLARVEAPAGTFILYSAGYRQTALDGLGPDDPEPTSVYTRVLLRHLVEPGKAIDDVAQDVRREVEELARTVGHEQRPAYYDELSERVVLALGEPSEDSSASSPSANDPIAADYSLAAQIGTAAAWDVFLSRYGDDADNFYVQLAQVARQQLAALEAEPAPAEPATAIECEGGLIAAVGDAGMEAAAERCLKPGDTFKDCDNCPEMVVIPPGAFTMGGPPGEGVAGFSNDEGPQHEVSIAAPFAVGKFELTFDEWEACVADGGCGGYQPGDEGWGRGNRPVIHVNWDDAEAYVAWVARRTNHEYRLLTEAEWEYAARAGTTTPFSTGRTITTDQANFDGNYAYRDSPQGVYREKTVAVGTFAANPFGLHDMHGNVYEWVEDCYRESYGGAPSDGSARASGSCETTRVLRGGSWNVAAWDLRSAVRYGLFPPSYRDNSIGFRVARTLD